MAVVSKCCDYCSSDALLVIEQSVAKSELCWTEDICCRICYCESISYGHGIPPATIRAAIVDAEGLAGLEIVPGDGEDPEMFRPADLVAGIVDADAIGSRMPGIAFVGTHTEMRWLQTRLSKRGVTTKLEDVEPEYLNGSTPVSSLDFGS